MKLHTILLAFAITAMSFSAEAQTDKKETVKVWGNCGMCKSKIEKAAKAAGASTARWDAETQILEVAYNPSSTSVVKIEKSVAGTGYDTQNVKGSDEAYNSLHSCCQYERKGSTEANSKKKAG